MIPLPLDPYPAQTVLSGSGAVFRHYAIVARISLLHAVAQLSDGTLVRVVCGLDGDGEECGLDDDGLWAVICGDGWGGWYWSRIDCFRDAS